MAERKGSPSGGVAIGRIVAWCLACLSLPGLSACGGLKPSDLSDECDTGHRRCGGSCRSCPNEGVTATICRADRCVAQTCAAGYHLCADGCCPWSIRDLTSTVGVASTVFLALDGQERAHVLFGDTYGLWYLRIGPDSAQLKILVDDDGITGNAMVVDARDQPHILYSKEELIGAERQLLYAKWAEDDFRAEIIPTLDFSCWAGMAVGGDVAHVFFFDYDYTKEQPYGYYHGYRAETGWEIEPVVVPEPSASCSVRSMAVDVDGVGQPVAAWVSSDKSVGLSFRGSPGGWSTAKLEDSVATNVDLDLGLDDSAHLLVGDDVLNTLGYVRVEEGRQEDDFVANTDSGSIAVDREGRVHVAFRDRSLADLVYALNVDGTWHTQTVDGQGNTGGPQDIALDRNGFPVIVYFNASTNTLKLAR